MVISLPSDLAAPGVDARRLPGLAMWDTPAVHGWLQAHDGAEPPTLRVVSSADADLIEEGVERLEVPVTAEESAEITKVTSVPPVAEAQSELLALRHSLQEQPAIVERARAAGLSDSRIESLAGAPVAESSGA